MGCCTSEMPQPKEYNNNEDNPTYKYSVNSNSSYSVSVNALHPSQRPRSSTLQYRKKQEPTISPRRNTNSSCTTNSITPDISPAVSIEYVKPKTSFEIRVDKRKSEILSEKQKLQNLQHDAFLRQLTSLSSRNFKRLYDVYQEYSHYENGENLMDIDGLTKALAVFGMIILNRDLQQHIFSKFDLDNEKVITYNDFSATMATFVGNVTDDNSLQTLFEIFDIDQDGYLVLEDMARILLCQNQIAVVVTGGQQSKHTTIYTKEQTIKQARRMIAEHNANHNKISFNEFKEMMAHKTESDMMIDHMQAPSISMNGLVSRVSLSNVECPIFVPNE